MTSALVPVLGGLGASVAWACSTTCSAAAGRAVEDARTVVVAALALGLVWTLPLLLLAPAPTLDATAVGTLSVGGVGNALGLALGVVALQRGQLGVLGPIFSTEGAIAALIAVATGAAIGHTQAVLLAAILAGVVTASMGDHEMSTGTGSAYALGVLAALAFGVGLYGIGRSGDEVPLAWTLLPPRLCGVLLLAPVLLWTGRLELPRTAWRYVLATSVLEVGGFAAFAAGARVDLPVAAVMASTFGAVTVLLGRVAFDERLRRRQLLGVSVIVISVVWLTATLG